MEQRETVNPLGGCFADRWVSRRHSNAYVLTCRSNQAFVRHRRRSNVLNRYDRSSPMAGEAEVKYLDGDFRVVRPGAFVRCAVTGIAIPLEELKYWNVELQEAYASPEAVLQRHYPGRGKLGYEL
jgi:hypothetical protein